MANHDQMIAASTVGEWIQWGLELYTGGTELFYYL